MPFSYSSYADIGGSPFQQYQNQQQQFQLQQQQAKNQQNQQNPAFGGQNPQLGNSFPQQPTYGQQQQYGGMQQYNPLPSYNLTTQNQGFQPTPINQSDYSTYRSVFPGEQAQGQNIQFNPSAFPGINSNQLTGSPYNLNFNAGEQNYLNQQQPQTTSNPYSTGYNSLPNYNPFQYSSPAGGTGQYFSPY